MNRDAIGTCSICGGRVSVHSGPWLGIIPPTPHCERCGAVPAETYGPVIPMKPLGAPRMVDLTTSIYESKDSHG